jgi:hypothetical protein
MQSSSKYWHVQRTNEFEKFYTPERKDYSVALNSTTRRLIAGTFDRVDHAERFCALMNDTYVSKTPGAMEENTPADQKRMVMTMKLFALQENLTWADFGFDQEEIRNCNEILETEVDLRPGQ